MPGLGYTPIFRSRHADSTVWGKWSPRSWSLRARTVRARKSTSSSPPTLLKSLEKGREAHFTIDADKHTIVNVIPLKSN